MRVSQQQLNTVTKASTATNDYNYLNILIQVTRIRQPLFGTGRYTHLTATVWNRQGHTLNSHCLEQAGTHLTATVWNRQGHTLDSHCL